MGWILPNQLMLAGDEDWNAWERESSASGMSSDSTCSITASHPCAWLPEEFALLASTVRLVKSLK